MRLIGRVADVVLVGGGASCLAFALYNLLRHGWAWHYGFLVGAGGALLALLRTKQTARLNAAILAVSLLLPIYLTELVLASGVVSHLRFDANDWLNFPSDFNPQAAMERMQAGKLTGPKYDTRTRLEVVTDLRREGIRAYPLIFPEVMFKTGGSSDIRSLFTINEQEVLPLAGLANTPTVFCNESGEYIVYESDRYGFHNPPNVWRAPVQFAALGDSFTHGACVRSDHGFVALIRRRHPSTVNLGMNGNGPLSMLATLREFGPSLRPRTVLWVYFEGNDSRDLDGREKHSPLLMKYLDPSFSQGLMQRQQEIDHVLQAYLDEAIRSNAYAYDAEQFLKLHFLRKSVATLMKKRPPVNGVAAEVVETLQRFGAPLQEADRALFRRILTEANRLVASWGGQIYFVYLPTWERFRLPDLASKDRDAVLNLVKELGMRLIDLNPIFEQHPDPLSLFPTRRYAHYNDAGHALVAQEILRHLPEVGGPLSPRPAE
jgi:lysophospholipase L1-like esterase